MNKLSIIAVIQYPITNLFDTLYLEYKKTSLFDFKFVIIPSKQPGLSVGEFKLKEIINYMNKKGYPYLKGYDEISKSYFDLKKLKPDIVFLQTPYDLQRGSFKYSSGYIKNFAKVANISYGAIMIDLKIMYENLYKENPFLKNCWKIFVENDEMKKIFDGIIPNKAVSIGYMKCDYLLNYKGDANYDKYWSLPIKDNFRIIWKPRWIAESKSSNLFKYLYYFIYLVENNSKIDFVWYMHPFIKSQIIINKLMSKTELIKIFKKIKSLKNFRIEESGDFLNCVFGADLYIGDVSSTLIEFALTGKPIIYTPTTEEKLNYFGKKIIKNSYIIKDTIEMTKKINELSKKIDPLKKSRQRNVKNISKNISGNKSIAEVMIEYINNHN